MQVYLISHDFFKSGRPHGYWTVRDKTLFGEHNQGAAIKAADPEAAKQEFGKLHNLNPSYLKAILNG